MASSENDEAGAWKKALRKKGGKSAGELRALMAGRQVAVIVG